MGSPWKLLKAEREDVSLLVKVTTRLWIGGPREDYVGPFVHQATRFRQTNEPKHVREQVSTPRASNATDQPFPTHMRPNTTPLPFPTRRTCIN